ncbi:MAG: hypothetical protein M3139_05455 [Bacteroidota bacterium]|nr:hypothetical protein [Bacteroidota bacterium]
MTTKIISMPVVYFKNTEKQRPLSLRMTTSLITACSKQHAGISFGQKDINSSFVSLVNRGLIERKQILRSGDRTSVWYVTNEAIKMLNSLGIEVVC